MPASSPAHVLRKRIARKILLGYVVPLAVLLVAGLFVPILFWSYLGKSSTEYDASVHAVDRVNAVSRAAQDAESDLRGYVRYHDETFRLQFQDAHDTFRDNYRDMTNYLDAHPNSSLSAALDGVGSTYRHWRSKYALPLVREGEIAKTAPSNRVATAEVQQLRRSFSTVQLALNSLIALMDNERTALHYRANADSNLRLIIALTVPTIAFLLSLLIARLNTLGITRPLEALIDAAETLEQGELSRVLVAEGEPYADDEIGDLQKAFRRMARTIAQREAILRAQNDALGSLNQRVEAVLNSTNDAIVMLDRGGGFSVVNKRFAYLFGLEPDVLLDHTFSQAGALFLSRFRNRDVVRAKLQEILFDPDAVADETYEIVEPVPRVLRMYSAPVRGGDPDDADDILGRIFVFRDATRETTVDRMKTEFVSTVSHELRTPLTAIKGYIDLMASGQTGPLTDVQREFLSLVQTSTRRLTALINDMLDISRIESGRIVLRKVSVDYLPLVQQTVRMMSGEAATRNITLHVEVIGNEADHPSVSGDSDRITQVLVNLLSNGIKYTPQGGEITVSVEYEGEFVTTCVADNGIGISREDQTRLFQKFFRADNSTTREVGGTGLGLAITRAILEKLNGGIWVESEVGKGSRFYFTLPTVEAAPAEGNKEEATDSQPGAESAIAPEWESSPTAPAASYPQPRKLILAVDSDLGVLHRLGHQLRRADYATSTAATAPEALRRARSLRPDLITLDPLTPGIDGFTLLSDLQSSEATKDTPIALLSLRSPNPQDSDLQDNVALLTKPFEETALCHLAEQAIRTRTAKSPAILIVGESSIEESLRRCLPRGGEEIRLVTEPTAVEAERHLGDPGLILIVLDTAAAPGTQAGEFAASACRPSDDCRVPFIVLTSSDLDLSRILPLVPLGDGKIPLSELGIRLEAMLTAPK